MSNKLEELDLLMPFDPQELPVEAVQQKHFTEPNGMLHTSYKDDQCLCSHRKSQHLFCDDVCLVAKPTICICDGFKNKNKSVATSSYEDQSKFRKWKKQQTKPKVTETTEEVENPNISDYIRKLSEIKFGKTRC